MSEPDRAYIERSIASAAASERLSRWGGLRESVRVEIQPPDRMKGCDGFGAFGLALGRNKMYLRAPKDTWHGARPLDYEKTVLHELGHLLEHQTAGQERPRWFAEGFANQVAGFPGYASREDVAWWIVRHGGEHPLEVLFAKCSNVHLAYAIATLAVGHLMELIGESGVRRLFELREGGAKFESAFAQVAGMSVPEFEGALIRHVRPFYYERAELTP